MLLPELNVNIHDQVKKVIEVVGPDHSEVTIHRKTVTIPWPPEISLHWLFLACFQLVCVIFYLNHPRMCTSMTECYIMMEDLQSIPISNLLFTI